MTCLKYRARWILPVEGQPLENGVLTVVDGRIAEIGRGRTSADSTVTDLGDVVLLPGLVNAHTHLEFSDCEVPLGRSAMSLPDWIRLVIGRRRQAADDVSAVIRHGVSESLQFGVTTLAEISTAAASNYIPGQLSRLLVLHEVIGFSPARADSVQRDLEQRLALGAKQSVPLLQGISPHAPYTVSWGLLESLVRKSQQLHLPVAMHLAESREELELIRYRTGPFRLLLEDRSMWDEIAIPQGVTILDYLRLLSEAPRALVIHGNYLEPDEANFLATARDRLSLVFCPRTHAYFAHEEYPLEKLLAGGVRVVLGTDGRASSSDLSLLAELRYVARNFPNLSTTRILQMATLEGAIALGLDHEVGSLRVGKSADWFTLPLAGADPLEAIFAGDSQPRQVMVRGQLLTPAS